MISLLFSRPAIDYPQIGNLTSSVAQIELVP